MVEVVCPQCKKDFKVYRYRVEQAKVVYCSRACRYESQRLPAEENHRRAIERQRKYRALHPEVGLKYRNENKERISQKSHEIYLKKKDVYIARAKESFKKRKILYNTVEERNLWENIKVVKFRKAKAEKDPEWKRKENEKREKRVYEYKAEAIENGAVFKGREWSLGEIAFLEKNRETMTTLQMAIALDRTYDGVRAAFLRFKIPNKNRSLKELMDKSRDEILKEV